ncbi:hypothetical protein MACH17_18610 [Phaeobacter inhibens]|uniref:hypothetical protein n=1 Tax=Phaeobacter inhibens TaxID=221822 RepID=UPI00276CF57F|nr:hypothetical protein [Phaeobacter inhibens]GLO70344.1 hypothetical protein MACH17_18610 [Phaeobacter inhibens]
MNGSQEVITIDPVTTAVGTDPFGSGGLIPVGTRLKDLPVEKFSANWMKAITKIDQGKLRSYQTRKEAEKKAAAGPDVQDALDEAATLRESIKTLNGSMGAMKQKLDAMQEQLNDTTKTVIAQGEAVDAFCEDVKAQSEELKFIVDKLDGKSAKEDQKPAAETKGEKPAD